MPTLSKEPMNWSTVVDLDLAFMAAHGLFCQGAEIERYRQYGTGKGGRDLIDESYGYTECCGKKYSNDMTLLRHRRSVEHGVGLAAKSSYGTAPYAPPGEWRYSTPNYLRFANHYLVKLAKKVAGFAGKIPAPVIAEGMLSDPQCRRTLAMDLAKAYIERFPPPPTVTSETEGSET